MTGIRVAVFDKTDGQALGEACRGLAEAGYRVIGIGDELRFADTVSFVNCGVVFAYELSGDLIPTQLDGTHLPPIVLVSPMPTEHAVRSLPDSRVVQQRIDPTLTDRLLISAVTRCAITDILRRLTDAVMRQPGLTQPLRSTMRTAAAARKRTIRHYADSSKIVTRTLEAHWVRTFGPEPPKLKDFCRGVWLLQIIREAAGEPLLVWSTFGKKHGVARSTLRRMTIAFAGQLPSELDIAGEPGTLLTRVCTAAIPPPLLETMLGDPPS